MIWKTQKLKTPDPFFRGEAATWLYVVQTLSIYPHCNALLGLRYIIIRIWWLLKEQSVKYNNKDFIQKQMTGYRLKNYLVLSFFWCLLMQFCSMHGIKIWNKHQREFKREYFNIIESKIIQRNWMKFSNNSIFHIFVSIPVKSHLS